MSLLAPEIKIEEKLLEAFNNIRLMDVKRASNPINALRSFYEIVPIKYLKKMDDEALFEDLKTLVVVDNIDHFWDASTSIINFLGAFDSDQFIYDKLYANPAITRKIYDVLNDDKDKQTYCSFLTALSVGFNIDPDFTEFPDIIELGGRHEIDSDLFFGEKDSIRIKNELVHYITPVWEFQIGQYDAEYAFDEEEDYRDLLLDKQYNPLDIVIIRNDKSVHFVSALQVKLMADTKEWGNIVEWIHFGINLLLVALPFGIYAAGVRGFFLTLSIIDASIVLVDYGINSFEDLIKTLPGGEEFFKLWKDISALLMLGTGVLALPSLITAIGKLLIKGAFIILVSSGQVLKQTILILRYALINSGILKFLGTSFRIVINAVKYSKIAGFASQLERLQRAGVLIVRVPSKNRNVKGGETYHLIYDGTPIASGKTAKELKEATKRFFGKNGEIILKALKESSQSAKIQRLISFLNRINKNMTISDLTDFGIKVLFRGTTTNPDGSIYIGNPNSQANGLSTSTDPLRAIIFAIESATKQNKKGIIQVLITDRLPKFKLNSPNHFSHYELEVVLNIRASELSAHVVKEIPVEKVRELANKFFKLPESLPTRLNVETSESRWLMRDVLPKSTLEDSYKFYEELIKL
ncbi:MAG: hypothetical protein GQ574_26315 [Crocinitomix sp.]|nr:hypothetical protein [Crocinitomix sp.]